jgi:hypothetical protein
MFIGEDIFVCGKKRLERRKRGKEKVATSAAGAGAGS